MILAPLNYYAHFQTPHLLHFTSPLKMNHAGYEESGVNPDSRICDFELTAKVLLMSDLCFNSSKSLFNHAKATHLLDYPMEYAQVVFFFLRL